jgi:hypothetical protein
VGVRQHLAVPEDDARAALPRPDPDDRGPDALGNGGEGGLELVEDGHGRFSVRVVTCN